MSSGHAASSCSTGGSGPVCSCCSVNMKCEHTVQGMLYQPLLRGGGGGGQDQSAPTAM